MTTQQLNEVATLLGTESKELVFATCIKFLVEEGMEVGRAINAVLGEGSFEKISDEVCSKLAR